ncbi:excalibur domain-containing protein [Trypanosoma theileri]|uniref:Excalibur domain-containing protein n=1 Tax=Trypanosoma theileri TaxID=67003 RepID=A0A1X0NM88_9TRYP|nr:excalibur domain-containing protein [Trypanosoma theileri]ORC85240.1 excalibur domain-containing protein [Trypanosoma theileri]
MTTMSIQLRRVVFLLVLLQCCVCVACAEETSSTEPTGECEDQDEIKRAERSLGGIIDPSTKALGEAQDCLTIWKKDVGACNANYEDIESAVNATILIFKILDGKPVEGFKPSKVDGERCGEQKVKDYAANLGKMVEKVNAAIRNMPELYKKATEKAAVCVNFQRELDHLFGRLTGARVGYFPLVSHKSNVGCMTRERILYIENLNKTYEGMKAVSDGLKEVQGRTQLCRMNSEGESPKFMKRIGEFRGRCQNVFRDEVRVEDEPDVKFNLTEVFKINGSLPNISRDDKKPGENNVRPGTYERVRKDVINRVKGDLEVAKQKRIAEERKRADEEKVRRIAEEKEKRNAEEKARREREEQERLEAERVRKDREDQERLDAEKTRKAREEQERLDAEKTRKAREEQERSAMEKARQEAREKAKQKKKVDGSSPALVHGPLLLLLLCVMGCTLVCGSVFP